MFRFVSIFSIRLKDTKLHGLKIEPIAVFFTNEGCIPFKCILRGSIIFSMDYTCMTLKPVRVEICLHGCKLIAKCYLVQIK